MHSTADLMTPENCRNPYPLYEELRRDRPVCHVEPGGLVAVSRYKDVEHVLKHPEVFSSHGFRVAWEPEWVVDNPLAHGIVAQDGAEHLRLRSAVSRAFTPVAINRLGAQVRETAAQLADALLEQGEADFMDGFATPLPARAMSGILGLDPSLERHYKRWTEAVVGITPVPLSEKHIHYTRATIVEMKAHMQRAIDERRQQPTDDLLGLIVRGKSDSEPLSNSQMMALCFNLLTGGLETTSFFFSNAVRVLAERPDVYAQLRADRTLLPQFIEEVLRYDGPVRGLPRIVTSDVELSGVRIERGACVLLLVASANRDEAQFQAPNHFDLQREQKGISFGYGTHYCVGAFLARLEAQAGLEALLDRFSGFSLIPERLVWNRGIITSGPEKMPVRFLSA
ncbi:cytochrome P450 [Stigmatella aurantiaca]|uniref:Cytochrome P450 n=1 Tax=Stigmatella aurantiaca (strain DW4/3-1) TaxID=378806 RepID=Q09AC5_STIAD|nr:cytochrome P450 [Stigmatella aurantiaca]ADO75026.1 Cytochrome P450 [Stigmatella aurantiaca DW4/3-1]EAU68654.1 cytochrome P450 107B1 [Stigmatella aurantiaca DW4/3-1]